MRRVSSICLVLAALVLAVYWPVGHFAFIDYDDPAFITGNPQVRVGVTWSSVRYALAQSVVGNWHPVTTLSHILDCQIFGVHPGPMHFVNAAFHAANALLLFLVLRRMTGAIWRSAIVAAFFALHPLRVESVAWISERKDVLSAFFFLLTIWAYVRYVQVQSLESRVQPAATARQRGESPKSKAQSQRSVVSSQWSVVRGPWSVVRGRWSVARGPWSLSLLFFTLGLMSKPMLITLPFVLLLLDYWPLGRIAEWGLRSAESRDTRHASRFTFHASRFTLVPLLVEKLPFFALAAIFSVVTLVIQTRVGATAVNARFTLADRVGNALVSYVKYLGKTFWPTDLAIIYPHPGLHFPFSDQWPEWQLSATALVLVAISALCLCEVRRRPYLAVGWFWYLGMMVPVIGLIQVGEQAMADRYTYLPLIGPVLSLVWLLSELACSRTDAARSKAREPRGVCQSRGALELRHKLPERQSTGALQNPAENLTVFAEDSRSSINGALAALTLLALSACAVLTRHQLQYWRDTVTLFEHAVEITADNPGAQFCLGIGLEKEGQLDRAMVHYRVAVAICPTCLEAHSNMGHLLRTRGKLQEAIVQYLAAIRSKPDDLPSHLNLAGTLLESGQTREAVPRFEEALQIDPDSIEALNNLAWILAASGDPGIRNGARAVEYGERACRLTESKQTIMVGTLAAAYAEAGRFADAIATAEKACALAAQNGELALLEKNRQLLELYRAGKPYREPAAK